MTSGLYFTTTSLAAYSLRDIPPGTKLPDESKLHTGSLRDSFVTVRDFSYGICIAEHGKLRYAQTAVLTFLRLPAVIESDRVFYDSTDDVWGVIERNQARLKIIQTAQAKLDSSGNLNRLVIEAERTYDKEIGEARRELLKRWDRVDWTDKEAVDQLREQGRQLSKLP
jgi:hypothetical protein